MPEQERAEILRAFRCVDEVMLTFHEPGTQDMSVCKELEFLKPNVFCNGGDRKADNIPEYKVCEELGIEMAFNIGHGGKVQSSSELAAAASKAKQKSV